MTRRSLWLLVMLALFAVCEQAQAQDTAPDFGNAQVTGSDLIWLTDRDLNLILPAATGGNGAITYSLSPVLNNASGLTFDAATRTISGRPALSVGTNDYTLTATDADGDTDTLTFRAEAQADSAPAFADDATVANQTWISHLAINLALPAASSATAGNILLDAAQTQNLAPLTYALTPALPAGLRFDADTRTISGAPAATATAITYAYTVADGDSNTSPDDADTLTFAIAINATSCADGKVPLDGDDSCVTPAEKCAMRGWDKTTGAVCHFGNRGGLRDLRSQKLHRQSHQHR